jgi:iron(III) transport system ATP-binding protein
MVGGDEAAERAGGAAADVAVRGASLAANALTKSFAATEVLRGLDLEVPAGTLTAVLGPSGCGKTTLLRLLAGFERPDGGTVRLGGRELAGPGVHVAAERRRIGLVPQEGALFPHLSVAANVGFGLPRRRRAARVAELLELLDLGGLGKRRPDQLSGGQQQRVALARALAPTPEVILLDEPFDALDAGLRAQVRAEVRDALRRTGTTGLLVTHDQEEALSLADLVAAMRDGAIAQLAPPRVLYREPVDAEVARFVGEAVLLDATLISDSPGAADTVGATAGTGSPRLAAELEPTAVVGSPRPATGSRPPPSSAASASRVRPRRRSASSSCSAPSRSSSATRSPRPPGPPAARSARSPSTATMPSPRSSSPGPPPRSSPVPAATARLPSATASLFT